MDTAAFEARLNELLSEISDMPNERGKKLLLLTQKKKTARQKPKKGGSLNESLDYLRLIMKYMVFDVEATRRENSYLRKMLDGRED